MCAHTSKIHQELKAAAVKSSQQSPNFPPTNNLIISLRSNFASSSLFSCGSQRRIKHVCMSLKLYLACVSCENAPQMKQVEGKIFRLFSHRCALPFHTKNSDHILPRASSVVNRKFSRKKNSR